jgi:hypothetical protein
MSGIGRTLHHSGAGCVTGPLERVEPRGDPLTASPLQCDDTSGPRLNLQAVDSAATRPSLSSSSGPPPPPVVKLMVTPTLSSGGSSGGRPFGSGSSGASSPQRPRGSISSSFNSIMDSMGLSSSHKNQVFLISWLDFHESIATLPPFRSHRGS